ncbi:uncharacterized protein TNCV_1944351 [Trichonephila clavipes]|nr:uncharacterized protein TNCV_1944351 [Trichonephila clavipes]
MDLGARMGRQNFSYKSRFSLLHRNGRIRICRQGGERTLTACIRLHHTAPSSSVMVLGTIGCTSRSPLVGLDGTLNSERYISGVLRCMALPFIRVLQSPMFKQHNARPHVPVLILIAFT